MPKTLYINGRAVKAVAVNGQNVKAIGDGVNTLWEQAQPNYFYFEDRSGEANAISIIKTGDTAEWLALEYSTDKETWTTWDFSQTLTLPANGKVYLKGNNTYGFGKDNSNYHTFTCTGNYALGGDLFSIMDDSLDTYPTRFGSRAFNGSTTLVDISQLVFGNRKMVGLVFTWMFQNCTSLTSLPNEIGVSYPSGTDLSSATSHFLQMFQTSPISNYPTFPNITAIGKSGMYRIALTTTQIPNTSLKYLNLSNITTLYNSALYLSFGHCQSLEVVKLGISTWPNFADSTASDYNATYQWLVDVHSTGVFCKNSTLPVTRGDNYIPNNWSIADLNGKLYAPVITENGGTITIAEAEGGASCQIYYTTDGTTPTTNSTLYTQPFAVAAGTTVKAIAHYNGQSAALVTDSDVTEYTTSSVTYYSYIHNQTVGTGDTNHRIDTGILPTTSTVFRFKGKFVGYDQGGVWVGTQGSSDSNDYRFFYANSYYFDWNSGRLSGGKLNNGDIIDVTCSNYRMYDNVNDRVISSGSTQNSVPQYNILVDVGSLWVKSLEIWDNGVLVFDGRAAELNGSVGLYDSVSGTLFTNSNLTIVGETSSLLPPTIAMNQNNIKITTNDFGTTYYTTDGTTPNENSTAYTQEFPAVLNQTIKAVTIDGGVSSTVASYTVTTSQLSSPSISRNQNNVKITQGNQSYKSVSIYYTTDGTTPTSGSTLYTGEFTAVLNQTIKAVCISSLDLYTQSTTTTYTVTASQLTAPTITRVDNNVALAQTNDNYKSVSIYYTTDGTTPSSGSTLYTAPFAAVLGQTVKAVCISSLDLYTQSATTTFEVVATQLASPKIAYNNGYVTLTDQNNVAYGAELHYTTDGTTPDATSTLYTEPFAASVGDTIKAIAITTNNLYTNSDVKTKEIGTHSLPSNTFLVNYNSKEFDTTTNTFPKTTGQLFDKDLVLNNAPASTNIPNGYVTMNGRSYMDNQFTSYTYNIFNRYNNANERTLTLVYKVNWSGAGGGEAALFGNRGTSAQSSYNYHNYMIRYKAIGGLSNLPSLSAGANFGVYYCRINSDASGIFKCVTNGEYVTGQNITYPSNPSGNVTFFGDSDYGTSTSFHYQGDFYWLYISNEALTDAEIDAVIDYNENL